MPITNTYTLSTKYFLAESFFKTQNTVFNWEKIILIIVNSWEYFTLYYYTISL